MQTLIPSYSSLFSDKPAFSSAFITDTLLSSVLLVTFRLIRTIKASTQYSFPLYRTNTG